MSDWWIVEYYKVPAENETNAMMRYYAAKHNNQEKRYFSGMKIYRAKKQNGWKKLLEEWGKAVWNQLR
jgi:hypothetical protein